MIRSSLAARAFVAAMLAATVAACVTTAALTWTRSPLAIALAGIFVALPVSWWCAKLATSTWSQVVQAVRDGVMSLRDRDFSVSITPVPDGDLKELVLA